MTPRIGVCSWSLRPSGPADLAAKVRGCGLGWVQLALDPIRSGAWSIDDTRRELDRNGVRVLSGMMAMEGEDYSTLASIRRTGGVVRDETWSANLAAARENAALARGLGLSLVTFHAGFIPENGPDSARAKLLDRLRQLIDVFGREQVAVGLETGQESASVMLRALEDLARPSAGVNFDPANMLLYAMGDPVMALDLLHHRTLQIHVKDGTPSPAPGEWGTEVPAGTGAVDWDAFFAVFHERGLMCDLVIERESGEARIDDVRRASAMIARRMISR